MQVLLTFTFKYANDLKRSYNYYFITLMITDLHRTPTYPHLVLQKSMSRHVYKKIFLLDKTDNPQA